MQITFDVTYDETTEKMNLHAEFELFRRLESDDGTVKSIVVSPELAFVELIRDVAFGIIDPVVKSFWDRPINLVEEFEEYHAMASKKIARGDYGDDVTKMRD